MKSQHRTNKAKDPVARTAPEILPEIHQLTTAEVLDDAEISFENA